MKKQTDDKNAENKKKEKQKITYIDDNSTIADMSGTKKHVNKSKSTFKEKWKTYTATVKKMVMPMLITLLAFSLVYLLILLAAGKLW